MLRVRPAQQADADALFDLARQAGPGFTSLAVGEDILAARLTKSVNSFEGPAGRSADHVYILMLEDTEEGEILGMSALKSEIGIRDPFFNFRLLKIAQNSNVTKKRFDMDVLILVNEYAGATEIGSLFVREDVRGRSVAAATGVSAGRLISQARYMLMAADRERFSDRIVSELRGHVDETGYSPFWEAIGRKFFHMDFNEADHISAEKDNQFILDLMPKHPIYADLLPAAAQVVIAQTHPAGLGAKRLLESEGFRYDGVIDIFDGGPSLSAPRDDIRTVRESRCVTAVAGDLSSDRAKPLNGLLSNDKIDRFRCLAGQFSFQNDTEIVLNPDTLLALDVKDGESVRIWIKR